MATFPGTDGNDTQTTGFDILYGRDGNDLLAAVLAGPAYIEGGRGDDQVGSSGLAGVTEAYGGGGNDVVAGHASGDSLFGGTGNDLVVGANVEFSIEEGVRIPVPRSSSGNDYCEGNSGADGVFGFDGSDTIYGGDGDDRGFLTFSFAAVLFRGGLFGGEGKDYVDGGNGDDLVSGGSGKDTLVGGRGKDRFLFDAKPLSANVDTVLDFSHKDDAFELDHEVFTKVGSPGFFPAGAFFAGAHAHDRSDRIIYDPAKGLLYYDSNGDRSGKEVLIAKLAKNLDLDFSDFFMSI